MVKECVLVSDDFIPQDEFKEFLKSIGYIPVALIRNFKMLFDSRVIEFVKHHQNYSLYGKKVYIGADTYKRRIEFYGLCYVTKVDTDKIWIISYDNVDTPFIKYVTPIYNINEYGYLTIGYKDVKNDENN